MKNLNKNSKEKEVDNAMDNYTDYLEGNGLSLVYANIIKVFLEFLNNEGIEFKDISQETLTHYFLKKKYKQTSKNLLINAGRNYADFLGNENAKNVFAEIKTRTVEKHLPEYITLEELESALVDLKTNHSRKINCRKLEVIVYTLFWFGCRRQNWLHLDRKDIDLVNCTAVFKNTKTKVDYSVSFPAEIGELLSSYFQSEVQEEDKNFCNITEQQLRDLIEKMQNYLQKPFHIHTMRHSVARHLVNHLGVPVNVVQAHLNHSSLETTTGYLRNTDEDNRKIMSKHINHKGG